MFFQYHLKTKYSILAVENKTLERFKKAHPEARPILFRIPNTIKHAVSDWYKMAAHHPKDKATIEHLMAQDADTFDPIIIHKYGSEYRIIDGWHRTYVALLQHKDALKAYVLTPGEEITAGDKIYYHGRNDRRPYSGKYIFITDSKEYAERYGKDLRQYTLPFGDDKLFSIKNKNHLKLLEKYLDDYTIKKIVQDSGPGNELDWAAFGYISSSEYDEGEDLLEHLGFYGVKLQERTGIESILVFDEGKLNEV